MNNFFPILYEDGDVLAIDKPAGIAVHNDGRSDALTIADWFAEAYPEVQAVGEPLRLPDGTEVKKPGIVHRLDAGTTGVLVLAKNQEAFFFLKRQFQERLARKTYRAFVYGEVKQDEGMIDRPIGKSRSDFRRWSAERGARGVMREARTQYKTLERWSLHATQSFFSKKESAQGISYMEAHPLTGRTHQIRVHFKAIQHPILCDALYAPNRPCILGFSRPALHALALEIALPRQSNPVRIEAPLPPDFSEALGMLRGAVAREV